MRWLLALACVLSSATALNADIDVQPQYKEHAAIVVTVVPSDVPQGARVRSSIAIQGATVRTFGDNHCVWAPPGSYTVVASGVWVLTEDVNIGDQTVPVLVDFGQYQETANFTIGEGTPPTPPPTPSKKKWLIIIEESSKRTSAQANLYTKLRVQKVPRVIIADQHDASERVRQYVALIPDGTYLPRAIVVDEDGTVVQQAPLPDTIDAVKELIQ